MSVSSRRPLAYAFAAVLCLGAGIASHFLGGSGAPATSPVVPKPKRSEAPRAPGLEPAAVSAPAPEVALPPSSETTRALQAELDRDPGGQAQRRAIEAKAAAGVDAVMRSWRENPRDQETVVQTVAALQRIGTSQSAVALEQMKQESPMACAVEELLGGSR